MHGNIIVFLPHRVQLLDVPVGKLQAKGYAQVLPVDQQLEIKRNRSKFFGHVISCQLLLFCLDGSSTYRNLQFIR